MTKIFNEKLEKVEYFDEDQSRALWRNGNLVYKTDSIRLGQEWQMKMQQIVNLWDIPGFKGFIPHGYVTKYIDGTDLQGNQPFKMNGSAMTCILNATQKLDVLPIFSDAIRIGEHLGFTLGDITCGNILTDGTELYLIDYEVITPYPLNKSYLGIWNNTLKLLFDQD